MAWPYPNPTTYPSTTLYPARFGDTPDLGPVGPPRAGLRPGAGRTPGHLIGAGSEFDISYPWRRILYPSLTIYPSPGLYPARTDFTPWSRSGVMRVRGRMSFELVRDGFFRNFLLSLVGEGHFAMTGVFSSDLYGRMTGMVEIASYDLDLELASVELDVEVE